PEGVPELSRLTPHNSTSIFFLDADALRRSDFLARMLTELDSSPAEDPDYAEFQRATGFDYTRDLHRALLALLPGEKSGAPITFAVAEGRFDRPRISAYAAKFGRQAQVDGITVHSVTTGKPPRTTHFVFLSESRVAITNAANPAPLFSAATKPAALPEELRQRISRVGGGAVFAFSRAEKTSAGVSVFGANIRELQEVLRHTEWVSVAARPDGERLKVSLEADCATIEQASEAAQSLQAFLLFGRLVISDASVRRRVPPNLFALVEFLVRNGEVRHAERLVQVRLDVPAEVLRNALPAKSEK
ncbi:MAG TPA: hypothetical protein VNL38_00020, partial [Candidatus Nitrosotenuis sp.]|nr:hypothetical protein [Candidatus Nitrosotenuis sp.]